MPLNGNDACRLLSEDNTMQSPWRRYYLIGAVSATLSLLLIALDVILGNITGGDLTQLPQTAAARFGQLQANPMLGLYHLDLLNVVNQLVALPAYFALCAVHRRRNTAGAIFVFVLHLLGTALFVAGNKALPMLELSRQYFAAVAEAERLLYAAAGEALLAEGAHGSYGVMTAFLLSSVAAACISLLMLRGQIFGKLTAWLGIMGSLLLALYIIIISVFPRMKSTATLIAMPGGLMMMVWMILFTIRLFRAGFSREDIAET